MKHAFFRVAEVAAHAAGHPLALSLATVIIAALYLIGGIEITNFTISVVSLILLFLLQASQNRDGAAIQAKLDELIRSSAAENRFIGIDREDEDTIKDQRKAISSCGPPASLESSPRSSSPD